jgi:hypothetical protein
VGLKEHFFATRAAYDDEVEQNLLGSLRYRLSVRRMMLDKAVERGDFRLALDILRESAEDQGGRYTNRREMSGPKGGSIPVSVESRRRELAGQMLARLLRRGTGEEEARTHLISLGVAEEDLPRKS